METKFKVGEHVVVEWNDVKYRGKVIAILPNVGHSGQYVVEGNRSYYLYDQATEKKLSCNMTYFIWPDYCLRLDTHSIRVGDYDATIQADGQQVTINGRNIPFDTVRKVYEKMVAAGKK